MITSGSLPLSAAQCRPSPGDARAQGASALVNYHYTATNCRLPSYVSPICVDNQPSSRTEQLLRLFRVDHLSPLLAPDETESTPCVPVCGDAVSPLRWEQATACKDPLTVGILFVLHCTCEYYEPLRAFLSHAYLHVSS